MATLYPVLERSATVLEGSVFGGVEGDASRYAIRTLAVYRLVELIVLLTCRNYVNKAVARIRCEDGRMRHNPLTYEVLIYVTG
jgi:hypothetical protein